MKLDLIFSTGHNGNGSSLEIVSHGNYNDVTIHNYGSASVSYDIISNDRCLI